MTATLPIATTEVERIDHLRVILRVITVRLPSR